MCTLDKENMVTFLYLALGLISRVNCGQPVSSCQDLDTQACAMFQKANPDICQDQAFSFGSCKRFCGNCPLECYMCLTPVLDPLQCNTTISCADDQTCMIKHLKSRDGHHEYIMMCEANEVCEGMTLGFQSPNSGIQNIIGKRTVNAKDNIDDTLGQLRYDRDISISCCDTNFCNFPITTTTSPPTSPGPFPYGCNRDIVIVLDESGSVGLDNFRHALDFIKQIVNQIDIGPTKAQVALVSYSTHAHIKWYLDQYSTKQEVIQAVDSVTYLGGVTNTDESLEVVRTQVLTSSHGDRFLAKNVVIVLTDGQSNDRASTIREAQKLHLISDDIISIAIGAGINTAEIKAIATDNHHIFDIRSYSALTNIVNNVLQIICNT